MLALTRKKGESIMVGDNVEVIVLGLQGEQVRLGIIAPKNVAIHRKEIFEQIQSENREALGNVKMNALKDLSKK
jgi:carbon storage regulator